MSDTKVIPSWVHVTPTKGGPGTVTLNITTDENENSQSRTAYINIKTGGIVKSIMLTQHGNGALPQGESIYEMGPAVDTIVVRLKKTTPDYMVNVRSGAGWIVPKYISRGAKYDSLAFILNANATMDDRNGEIWVSDPKGAYKALLKVKQPSAAVGVDLDLNKVALPSKGGLSADLEKWVDSVYIVAFDRRGQLIFKHSVTDATVPANLKFRAMPVAGNIRNSYPGSKVYLVANASRNLNRFLGDESAFRALKDTAASRVFGKDGIQPPLSSVVTTDLKYGANRIQTDMGHITAQVTFNVFFDPVWQNPPEIQKLSIGGFTSWGYFFQDQANPQTPPPALTFTPSVPPNSSNQYLFFAYEKSLLTLTVRVGGRYYQGVTPSILKRGYKYTFNMRLCENGHCHPSADSTKLSSVAPEPGSYTFSVPMKEVL